MESKRGRQVQFNIHQDIDRELLIHQNTALSNRLDHKNQQIVEINEKCASYQRKLKGFQLFFSNFFGSWKQFMKKLENIHTLMRKSKGDQPIYSKLSALLENLKDIELIPDKFSSQKNDEISQIEKNIKQQVESFFKSSQNFYYQWLIENQNYLKNCQELLESYSKNKASENQLSRILRTENQELQQKLKQYESMFKEKTTLTDASAIIEAQLVQTEFNALKEKYQSLLDSQECVSRRMRKLMDYCNPAIQKQAIYPKNSLYHTLKSTIATSNSKPKLDETMQTKNTVTNGFPQTNAISTSNGAPPSETASPASQKTSSNTMAIEEQGMSLKSENIDVEPLDDDDYECFCGGAQFNYIKQVFEISLTQAINNPMSASISSELVSPSSALGNGPLNPLLGPGALGTAIPGGIGFNPLNLTNEINSLQQKVEDLSDENVSAKQEIEKLRMQLKNQQEGLFNSTVFQNLVEQGQELIKYIAYQQQQLFESNSQILEIQKDRSVEIRDLMHRFYQEKEQLLAQINQLREVEVRLFHSDKFREQLTQYDLSNYTQPLQQRIDESIININQLHTQNTSLQTKLDGIQQRYDDESKKNHELLAQNIKLQEEQSILRSRISGQFAIENIVFRHHQHQEFLLELQKIIDEQYPMLKEKFTDMVLYVKSRDNKVEMVEAKFQEMKAKEQQQKQSIESYLDELQLTSNGYTEINQQKNALLASLQSKDEEISNIIHEKNLEKTQAEKEKVSFNVKMRLDNETINKLNAVVEEYKEKVKYQVQVQEKLEEQISLIQSIREQADQEIDGYLKTIDELTIQLKHTEGRFSSVQVTLNETIKDSEQLKLEIKKQEDSIKQKSDIIKTLEEKGDTIMRIELQKYREMIMCSVCKNQQKKLIITKCNHLYCKQCIENSIQNRNRQCPQCRARFGENDIKDIFWS